ncbi:hypothetical protein U1Q18_002505 [Sarracenia purpurea var. burkii]
MACKTSHFGVDFACEVGSEEGLMSLSFLPAKDGDVDGASGLRKWSFAPSRPYLTSTYQSAVKDRSEQGGDFSKQFVLEQEKHFERVEGFELLNQGFRAAQLRDIAARPRDRAARPRFGSTELDPMLGMGFVLLRRGGTGCSVISMGLSA